MVRVIRRFPRTYTPAETVRAISKLMAARPDGLKLACPIEIRNIIGRDWQPVVVVLPTTSTTQYVRRWVEALDQREPLRITLTGGWGGNDEVRVRADGHLVRGPRIILTAWVYGVRLAEPLDHEQERETSLDELHVIERHGVRR